MRAVERRRDHSDERREQMKCDSPVVGSPCINISMSWDAEDVALLRKLWAGGHSAGQIADQLGHSRNAVCAKLKRLNLKRGHKPPTSKPKIMSMPKRRPTLAACTHPVEKVVSRKRARRQPREFSKRQLYAMLAEAVRNTG
jgi:GcrA cell cycle regulator